MRRQLAIPAIIAALLVPLLASIAHAYVSFEIVGYSWKSRTGGHVYPGSRDAVLVINVKYTGNETLEDVTGCLQLPEGFTPSANHGTCSPAFVNNTLKTTIRPGDVLTFRYWIDVARNVTPGEYYALLTINYYSVASGSQGAYGPFGIKLVVSKYPPLNIAFVEAYWEPGAYIGVQGATFHIVLRFDGSEGNRLLGGTAYIRFMTPEFFRPNSFHVRLGAANEGDNIYIDLSGVSIKPSAKPGFYNAYVEIRGSAETSDGVRYTAREVLVVTFRVLNPPPISVKLLDYGFEGIVEPGSRDASIYVTLLQYEPGVSVRGVVARAVFENALLANGSRSAVYAASLNAGYGDTFTMRFDHITIMGERVIIHLNVSLLVEERGSLYWTHVAYNLSLEARRQPLNISVIGVWWEGGVAYPGSSGLTLRVQLANLDYRDVEGGVATLVLPEGFEPRNVTIQLPSIRHGSVATLDFRGVSIGLSVKSGYYPATLHLRVIASSNGSYREYVINAKLLLRVASLAKPPLGLASIGWSDGIAFIGESGATLEATLYNRLPGYSVNSAVIRVVLPGCILYGSSNIYNATLSASLGYGEYATIRVEDLRIECSEPGVYPVAIIVKGVVSRGEAQTWFNETLVGYVAITRPSLKFIMLSYEWVEGGYPGSRSSRLRVNLLYLTPWRLSSLELVVLPGSGARLETGSTSSSYTNVEYGDVIQLDVRGVDVDSENITLVVMARGVISTGSSRAPVESKLVLHVRARSTSMVSRPLIVTSLSVLYGNEPSLLVPGARNNVVRVRLLNRAPYRIASVAASLEAPWIHVKSVTGDCLSGVAPGSQCYIDFTVWVDEDAKPGMVNATLTLQYTVVEGSSLTLLSEKIHIPLEIHSIESVTPRLVVASVYWGGARRLPYPESGENTVNVVILNLGRWEARGIHARLEILGPRGVTAIVPRAVCTSPIAPGSACTLTFTLLVGETNSTSIVARLVLSQLVTVYGTNRVVSRTYTLTLPLAQPPFPMVTVGQHGWLNGWHVFPGTDNAVYRVILGNTYPLPLTGIEAWIEAPGLTSKRVYAAGPIQPYASVELRIPVNVSSTVKPGMIDATLVLVYTVDAPGVEWRHVTRIPLQIRVDSVEDALQVVRAYWVGGAVRGGTAGAKLRIVVRNNLVAQLKGAIVSIRLPPGMRDALMNTSIAVTTPGGSQLTTLSSMPREALVAQILQAGGGLEATVPSVPQGYFIVADVLVNLGRVKPGYYNISVVIDFIDDWGSRHQWSGVTRVYVAGAPRLILVKTPAALSVANGIAAMTVRIVNLGSGPLLDAYLYLIPRVPLLVPNQSVFYLGVLAPNESKIVNVTLYYNPSGLTSWSGSKTKYSTIVFTYTIIYRDANGVLHIYNFTRGTQLLPFIELRLGPDTRAEQRGSNLIVSGTVINTGIATAHSISVEVVAGGRRASTFIGDLEPGDQTAFRVELGAVRRVEKAVLIVTYLDDYGRSYELNYTLPVYHPPVATTTTTKHNGALVTRITTATLITAPIVALATGYLLLRRRRREGVQ